MAVLIRLAVITGARRGELLALRWRDVDLKGGELAITSSIVVDAGELVTKTTKTGKPKRVALDSETFAQLKAWKHTCKEAGLAVGHGLSASSYVWSQRFEGAVPPWPDTVSKRWRKLADQVGLEASASTTSDTAWCRPSSTAVHRLGGRRPRRPLVAQRDTRRLRPRPAGPRPLGGGLSGAGARWVM